MNLNDLARKIAKREGKRVNVNIAQIKEIIRLVLGLLALLDLVTVTDLLKEANAKRIARPLRKEK